MPYAQSPPTERPTDHRPNVTLLQSCFPSTIYFVQQILFSVLVCLRKLYSSLWANDFLSYDKTELNFAHAHSIDAGEKTVPIQNWLVAFGKENVDNMASNNSNNKNSLLEAFRSFIRSIGFERTEGSQRRAPQQKKNLINNNYYPSTNEHRAHIM